MAPCPRIHKHLNFSFTVSTLLNIFVRSCGDWEKKCRIGIRQICSQRMEESLLCWILEEQSMGARNRLGIGLSYWAARPHWLAESISWNRFLGSLKVYNTWAGIFKEAMGAWNRRGRGLSYWPARLHRLAEFIPWNRFRDTFKNTGSMLCSECWIETHAHTHSLQYQHLLDSL